MSVIERLKKYVLVDGFHIVVDPKASHGSWVVDAETGRHYLDCYSQFASQALGWNHPSFQKYTQQIQEVAPYKIANSDMYSHVYADFVEEFASITPDFKYYFFIDGGALGVENALKAAFDWKCHHTPHHQNDDGYSLDVIHLKEAFHGRTGYTLSLTNTGELKTKWYPKFNWTRVSNPKIDLAKEVSTTESQSLSQMEIALKKENVAAIIMETIQGEGGDNHFRPQYFESIRELADKYHALFILDEVQCGMGLTGKWWAYEHMNVKPDIICFGKKTQVCGFCSTKRIELATDHIFKQTGRINSTWGGNFVDMSRATAIIKVIKEDNLVENAAKIGHYFIDQLKSLNNTELTNIRGRGLMIAFDVSTSNRRDEIVHKLQECMLVLKCGTSSIRFRPALTFAESDVDTAIEFLKKALC